MEKPFAPACERNRDAILERLKPLLGQADSILEIGAGTGQHAVHFAAAMPHLSWQTSDLPDRLAGIQAWLHDAALTNTPAPLALDVTADWPAGLYDIVYTANTLHIMSFDAVEHFFAKLPGVLRPSGLCVIYGPFHYDGGATAASNASFDADLRRRDPRMGVRDFCDIERLAEAAGLESRHDFPMPANNRLLIFARSD